MAAAPNAKFVARKGEVSAWDNADIVKAVEATGKKTIVMAGVWTSVWSSRGQAGENLPLSPRLRVAAQALGRTTASSTARPHAPAQVTPRAVGCVTRQDTGSPQAARPSTVTTPFLIPSTPNPSGEPRTVDNRRTP